MSLAVSVLVFALAQIKPPPAAPRPSIQLGPPLGYRFIEVAHSKDSYREFHGPPTVNAIGVTVFTATMDSGDKVIAFGSGGPVQFAATTADRFTDLAPTPVINDQWQVVFLGHIAKQGTGIFIKPLGGEPSVIADTLLTFTRFAGIPDIDSRGAVAFYGEIDTRLPTGGIPIPEDRRPIGFPSPTSASEQNPARLDMAGMGVFINNGIDVQVVTDNLRSFEKIDPYVSMSETGAVAFVATTRDHVRGVYVQQVGPEAVFPILSTAIRYADFGPPVLTPDAELCFWTKMTDGNEAILLTSASGGALREVIGTRPGVARTFDHVVAHTDHGDTLFIAREKTAPTLYLARRSGPPLKVVERGSVLGASLVDDLAIASRSVNENGQFCFWVKLKNGESGIYLGTPTR